MILGIDAINIRGGGITHIKNILIYKEYFKFKKIIIWGNKEVLKNIPNNSKIKKIHKNIFEKHFFIRMLWQLFFFNKLIKINKCNCVFYLSGYYFGNFKTAVIFLQNILPFKSEFIKDYRFLSKCKIICQKFFLIYSLKKSQHVIFPSNFFKKTFEKYNVNSKSSIIYHGAKKKFKKKINKSKKIRLVYISSFEPFKNHLNLFKAVQNLSKNYNIELDLFGPNNSIFFEKIIIALKEINLNKNIIFYKGFKNQNYIFKNYDVSVYPSLCESFGLPLVETLASGVKLACSNIPVFKEIVKNNAIYFNPKNSNSIARAILQSYKKKLDNKSISLHTWSRAAKNTFEVLYKVTNKL